MQPDDKNDKQGKECQDSAGNGQCFTAVFTEQSDHRESEAEDSKYEAHIRHHEEHKAGRTEYEASGPHRISFGAYRLRAGRIIGLLIRLLVWLVAKLRLPLWYLGRRLDWIFRCG